MGPECRWSPQSVCFLGGYTMKIFPRYEAEPNYEAEPITWWKCLQRAIKYADMGVYIKMHKLLALDMIASQRTTAYGEIWESSYTTPFEKQPSYQFLPCYQYHY